MQFLCLTKERKKSVLLGPGVIGIEDTDPMGSDSNGFCSHTRLLQHFVQSCFLYGSWGDLLLVSQKLKFPF